MATPPAAPTLDPAAYRRSLIAAAAPLEAALAVVAAVVLAVAIALWMPG